MSDYTFQVLTRTHNQFGHSITSNTSTEGLGGLRPGVLVALSGGSLGTACDASTRPAGIAYGSRLGVYRPQNQWYDSAEPFTIIMGRGLALIGADLFTAGSLPSGINTKLYVGANGTWAESGTYPVGRFIRSETYTSGAGVGSDTTVALVEFNLAPYTNP